MVFFSPNAGLEVEIMVGESLALKIIGKKF